MEVSHLKMNDRYLPYVLESLSANVQNIHMVSDHLLWLFCDSTDGANASVVCFTIIEMAKAYDLNIYKYLNFLLEKRPNARTAQKELEKLTPWNEEVQRMFARKMK